MQTNPFPDEESRSPKTNPSDGRTDAKRMIRKPVSVVHFTNSNVLGGAEQHLLTLLCGLDRHAFRLSVVCPEEVAAGLRADLPEDVELIPLALQSLRDWHSAVRFAKILHRLQADILHSHMFHSSLFASPIGWLTRVPVIIETPHISERWRHGLIKGSFVVDRFVGHFVDHYIAVSEANARYLIADKGLQASKVVVIPNSCSVGNFDPSRVAPSELKKEWNLGDEDPVLLVPARLEPQKGHDVLLDAMVSVHKEIPRAQLFLVGEGASRAALQAQVQDLKLGGTVHFTGYRRDVKDWLALADVVVLPSRWEGMPLVAIETLAAGRAIVATAVDGTPEVVVDGQCGIVVPPADPALMAAAIVRLLEDPELRRRFGRAGRRRAEEHFDSSLQVERTESLYIRALEQSARSPRMASRRRTVTDEATKGGFI